jgi:hypothetical protein
MFIFQTSKAVQKSNTPLLDLFKAQHIGNGDQILVEKKDGGFSVERLSWKGNEKAVKDEDIRLHGKNFFEQVVGGPSMRGRKMPSDWSDVHKLEGGKTKIGFELENGKTLNGIFDGYYSGTGTMANSTKGMFVNTCFFTLKTEFGSQNVMETDIKKVLISNK